MGSGRHYIQQFFYSILIFFWLRPPPDRRIHPHRYTDSDRSWCAPAASHNAPGNTWRSRLWRPVRSPCCCQSCSHCCCCCCWNCCCHCWWWWCCHIAPPAAYAVAPVPRASVCATWHGDSWTTPGGRERDGGLVKATFDRASKTLSSVFQIIFSIATAFPPVPPTPLTAFKILYSLCAAHAQWCKEHKHMAKIIKKFCMFKV